jgi:hypothetical protein
MEPRPATLRDTRIIGQRRALLLAIAAAAAFIRPAETQDDLRGAGSTAPRHEWAMKPWAPPKTAPPEHVAETYVGMDHELLAERAKARDAEDTAARTAEAARKAAEDKSPEAFLRGVRSFKPGNYELLFRSARLHPPTHTQTSSISPPSAQLPSLGRQPPAVPALAHALRFATADASASAGTASWISI